MAAKISIALLGVAVAVLLAHPASGRLPARGGLVLVAQTATTPATTTPTTTTPTTTTPTTTTPTTPAPKPPPPKKVNGCVAKTGQVQFHGSRWRHVVALTFDDGPWGDTPQFVSVLEHEHVHGTFFLLGSQVAGHGSLLRRELRDGDALGNHTWNHPLATTVANLSGQLSNTSAAIQRTSGGYRPCVFRPPYGAFNAHVVATARAQKLATIVWDVDPTDWARPGTGAIVSRVLAQVHNGSIVLMHDGGGPRAQTLAALPQIIHVLRSRGYRFLTVPELLGFPPTYAGGTRR